MELVEHGDCVRLITSSDFWKYDEASVLWSQSVPFDIVEAHNPQLDEPSDDDDDIRSVATIVPGEQLLDLVEEESTPAAPPAHLIVFRTIGSFNPESCG